MLRNYNQCIVLCFIVLNKYNIAKFTNVLLLLLINPEWNICKLPYMYTLQHPFMQLDILS